MRRHRIDSLPAWLLPACVFGGTLVLRTRGISEHFALLGDQIRDWRIALQPLGDLPLVGPSMHVGGYTIGPAYYWILWAIRVTLGPWLENLPHAGGIGQAGLQAAGDALLTWAVWKRFGSPWIAVTSAVLLATAAYDLHLSAVIWNPLVSEALIKAATALVLLDWPRRSGLHAAVTTGLAWAAFHAHSGTVFATLGILAAVIAAPLVDRNRAGTIRNLAVLIIVVAALQLPYAAHQIRHGFQDGGMGTVMGSVVSVLTGQARPQLAKSVAGFVGAVEVIQVAPYRPWALAWALLGCATIMAFRYRSDPAVLGAILAPQALAIGGYALFLGTLEAYYYLALMPAVVLTVVLGVSGVVPPVGRRAGGAVLLAAALALVPARLQLASTMPTLPTYGALVAGSRALVRDGRPARRVEASFDLPASTEPDFLYLILGGRIDPASPWSASIGADGSTVYRHVGDTAR